MIETISEAYNLVSASKTKDLSYNYSHDIVKEIGDKAMGKAIGVVSRQVLLSPHLVVSLGLPQVCCTLQGKG